MGHKHFEHIHTTYIPKGRHYAPDDPNLPEIDIYLPLGAEVEDGTTVAIDTADDSNVSFLILRFMYGYWWEV